MAEEIDQPHRMPPKLGGLAAIAGAVLLLLGTALHPMQADPNDPVAAFTDYAADELWVISHLVEFAGVAFLFFGLVALKSSLREDRSAWLADLGILVATAALAGAVALQAVDGVALKAMVDRWASAPAEVEQAAFQAALAVRQIEVGLAAYVALLFGSALGLFGGAVALSAIYPTWLGWLGVAGGIGTAAGGVLMAFTGFSAVAMGLSMPFSLLLIAWIAILGVLMFRERRSLTPPPHAYGRHGGRPGSPGT